MCVNNLPRVALAGTRTYDLQPIGRKSNDLTTTLPCHEKIKLSLGTKNRDLRSANGTSGSAVPATMSNCINTSNSIQSTKAKTSGDLSCLRWTKSLPRFTHIVKFSARASISALRPWWLFISSSTPDTSLPHIQFYHVPLPTPIL